MINGYQTEFSVKRQSVSVRFPIHGHISHDCDKNNNLNFFLKIQKMETKLNIWLSRDLTLMGRTLLAKTLEISKLVYTASMLTVPQEVIQRVQTKLFNFLRKKQKG